MISSHTDDAPTADTVAWRHFREAVAERDARLVEELRAGSRRLQALAAGQLDHLAAAVRRPAGPTLDALARLYQEYLPALLTAPLAAYAREGPQQRALGAFDHYDRSLEQIVQLMPETLTCSGTEWIAFCGGDAPVAARLWLRLRRRREVPVRPALALGMRAHRAGRRAHEGRLLVALAQMSLGLLAPWQAMRRTWFAPIAGEWAGAELDDELPRLRARCAAHAEAVDRAIDDLAAWLAHLPGRLAGTFTVRAARAGDRGQALTTRDDRLRDFLGRQGRAVDADLDLEARLSEVEADLFDAAVAARVSIETEHEALVGELNAVVAWLDGWAPDHDAPFPAAAATILSSGIRVRTLAHAADAVTRRLPASVEVSAHLAVRPGLRRPWTIQTPRAVVRDAFEALALPPVGEGMTALERQHQGIVLEIERAREVVTFAREAARANGAFEPRIEHEGIDNARSLLQHHRQAIGAVPPQVERSLITGLLRAFERTHRALEEGQWGVARQTARFGLPRLAQLWWRRAEAHGRALAAALSRRAARAYRAALVNIGWMPAPPPPGAHVVMRGYLTRSLGEESKIEQLPLIYQRLFRLVPVEDLRFLVGRDAELGAIAAARALWDQQRSAAVMLVGARGSGKTSLLNCALQRELAGLDVVRSEFVERLTTEAEMHAFLGALLGTGADGLDRALTSQRRVIVLEELERTFLRQAHGYAAIRALLGIISRTSRHNLWIVSMNQSCYRLLNAALRLEPHFSHLINATAVDLPHLREAVLMRHNLSGLRLRFAPPADQHSAARRLLRATGVALDPEAAFFDALYRESGGVFRTAFALWHRYIDRVEGGVLYMKQPQAPEYEAVVGALDVLDLFTLGAMLQHGSLTPREHSILFQIDETRSRSWLDNLLARELIEPDPGRYGLRVVPEAAPIVRQTLFRRNLG